MRRVVAPIAAALLIAACGSRDPGARQVASADFVPPVTQAPEPLAGQRQTTPLSAYIGRHPRDAVDGVSFFDRTEVSAALVDAVPDEAQRRLITGRDATTVPIFRMGSRVAAHGCAAHECGDRNWTVVIAGDGDRDNAAVCFHDTTTMGEMSRWSTRAGSETRAGVCPQA